MLLGPTLAAFACLTTCTVHAASDFLTKVSLQPTQETPASIQPTLGKRGVPTVASIKLAQAFVDQLMVPPMASNDTRPGNLPYQFLLNGSTSTYDTIMSTYGYKSLDIYALAALLPVKQGSALDKFISTVAQDKAAPPLVHREAPASASSSTVYGQALSGSYKITSPDRLKGEFLSYEGLRSVVTMNGTQYTAVRTNATDPPSFKWSDPASGASYQIVFTSDMNDAGDTAETSFTGQITHAGSDQIEIFTGKVAPFDPREVIPADPDNNGSNGVVIGVAVGVPVILITGIVVRWRTNVARRRREAEQARRQADLQAANIELGAVNKKASAVDAVAEVKVKKLRVQSERLIRSRLDRVVNTDHLLSDQDFEQMLSKSAVDGVSEGIEKLASEKERNSVRLLKDWDEESLEVKSPAGRRVKSVADLRMEARVNSYVGTHIDPTEARQMRSQAHYAQAGSGLETVRAMLKVKVEATMKERRMKKNADGQIAVALLKTNAAYHEQELKQKLKTSGDAVVEYKKAVGLAKEKKQAIQELEVKLKKMSALSDIGIRTRERKEALEGQLESALEEARARKQTLARANKDIEEARKARQKREQQAKDVSEELRRENGER